MRPYLEEIRDHIDHLELEIDDEIWPLPKYRESVSYTHLHHNNGHKNNDKSDS